jgi:hypothetical protein
MVGKNKDKFDIDTMDIKNHLDASFDIDKIKVSEDLIAKTLLAIENSEKENNKVENTPLVKDLLENSNDSNNIINIERKKSKLRFLPLKLATIAAAVFIFVVGMQTLKLDGAKKDSGYGISMKNEGTGNSTTDIYENADADIMADDNRRTEGSISINEYETESEVVDRDEIEDKEDTTVGSLTSEMDEYNKEALDGNGYIISSFYPIDNKVISEFIIKDEHDNLINTSKDTDLVKELYAILDEYPLTMIENKILEYVYQFDILTDENQSYTILVGSGIYVKTSDELEYTYYEINNMNELLVKLENFISTMP